MWRTTGTAKTDAHDAYVIADVLVGFDDDLACEVTRVSNRVRGLLAQIHPALERVLGPKIQHPAVLELLPTTPQPSPPRTPGRLRRPRLGHPPLQQLHPRRTPTKSGNKTPTSCAFSSNGVHAVLRGVDAINWPPRSRPSRTTT
jgi:transposase